MAKRGRKRKPETLTGACAKLLVELEKDLAARLDDESELREQLEAEYAEARAAGRTGRTKTDWLAEQRTQIGASWILACVFVRFAEDNDLIDRPLISGSVESEAGAPSRLARAEDAERAYIAEHPTDAEPEYLEHVFRTVADLPGMTELLDRRHAPLWRLRPRVEGARLLLSFFRALDDESGRLRWSFMDPELDTRFLGDLYQDLSEAVRKHYALLQTPDFVEAFILDRTLEPAVETFGLEGFRMIDPTCGSGHFLLGAFERLLGHWREAEPGTEVRELVRRALDAVHGVDLNPYAVAIARFRVVVAALQACGLKRLVDAPAFPLHLAVGDSLYHGRRFARSSGKFSDFDADYEFPHLYPGEVEGELRSILHQQYHCVVGNPPYITPKDKALNVAYRERHGSCSGKYALSVPFLERFVELAFEGSEGRAAGYVGQITSNSFMKREFGKKLIEEFFPSWDLTHVVDTSGAYIPGHGTPTVVLFLRNQRPVSATVRAVLGIRGEPSTPEDPAKGQVWSEILGSIDDANAEGKFVSTADVERGTFSSHPWSLGGGGASDLKDLIERAAQQRLHEVAEAIGVVVVTLEDEVFAPGQNALRRWGVEQSDRIGFVEGDSVRDWRIDGTSAAFWPYEEDGSPRLSRAAKQALWSYRSNLANRLWFRKKPTERGLAWFEYGTVAFDKLRTPLSITYAEIATHNHFVLDRGGKVFKQTAPVIKLPPDATEDDHYALLAILNSSTAGFWLQQMSQPKTQTTGADQEAFRIRRAFDASKVSSLPLPPPNSGVVLATRLDELASRLCHGLRDLGDREPRGLVLLHGAMVALQEELDWVVYESFGLCGADLLASRDDLPAVQPGARPFAMRLARADSPESPVSGWFDYFGHKRVAGCPEDWPAWYRELVERRICAIESDRNLQLLESPECKRAWPKLNLEHRTTQLRENLAIEAIEEKVAANRSSVTVASLAECFESDTSTSIDGHVRSRVVDVDAAGGLVESNCVPFLERLRLNEAGLGKVEAWHETWRLQRVEDPFLDEQEALLVETFGPELKDQRRARAHVACWKTSNKLTKEKDCDEDWLAVLRNVRSHWLEIDTRRQAAIGGEMPPVPPKYKPADFRSPVYWRLRGKLDVPKERFISYPFCSPDGDDSLLIGWAGWDHEQRAGALAQILEARKSEGWSGERLAPILLGIDELLFWLEKWHGNLADEYRGYLDQEVAAAGLTLDKVRAWEPPAKSRGRKRVRRSRATADE